jgi:transcription antitermination factor NusG
MLQEVTRVTESGGSAEPVVLTGQSNVYATARWYAAYTRARHEKQVKKQLEEKRIHCFLPLYRSVRRWKDRHRELELALFPGYVFVHVAPEDRLSVLQTPGVVHFVSFGVHPAALDDSEIESLRAGVANGVCAEPYSYLKVGRRVRVKHGPMAGAEGILVRKKDSLRIVLSIDLIMRSVAVEVHAADLE